MVPPGVDALAAGPGLMHPPWRKRGDEIALPPRSRTYDNAPAKRLIARCGHLARRSTRQGSLIEVSVAAVVEPPIATAVEPGASGPAPTFESLHFGMQNTRWNAGQNFLKALGGL